MGSGSFNNYHQSIEVVCHTIPAYLGWLSPDAVGLSERLLLRVPAVPEPRAEAEGRRPVERAGADLDEAEEGVVLDAALPQVLAGLPRRRLEPVCALVVLPV